MNKQPAVYLLAIDRNGTLYAGVTSNLIPRTWQHREHVVEGFSKRHDVSILVWYELHETMQAAILREKQIKKWNRAWKVELIEKTNPYWNDLWPTIIGQVKTKTLDDQRSALLKTTSRFRGNDEQKKTTDACLSFATKP